MRKNAVRHSSLSLIVWLRWMIHDAIVLLVLPHSQTASFCAGTGYSTQMTWSPINSIESERKSFESNCGVNKIRRVNLIIIVIDESIIVQVDPRNHKTPKAKHSTSHIIPPAVVCDGDVKLSASDALWCWVAPLPPPSKVLLRIRCV
jgi:hypothetical protein